MQTYILITIISLFVTTIIPDMSIRVSYMKHTVLHIGT